MKIYHTATQEDYDALMIELEEKGYKWLSGNKPTFFRYWESLKENTCIQISGKDIVFRDIEQCKKQHPNTPIIEYKAKGENMLNTECKQCHKKWHHDNAKYCSMCGKKLVYEPEFKVEDYIATKRYVGVISRVDKVPSDYDCDLYTVGGLFYDKYLELIGNARLFPGDYLGSGRIPTKEEISEYEAALNFHNHGRKPFEVKKGDLIRTPSKKFTFILNPENYTKEKFLDYDWEFLKTAEEVNEWLGVTDDE